jgi:hypothetical protein
MFSTARIFPLWRSEGCEAVNEKAPEETPNVRPSGRSSKGRATEVCKIRLPEASPSTQPDGTVHLEVINVPAIDEEHYMPSRLPNSCE